ncbi:hypothetical protein NEIRO03_2603, partial [Nematocida sp. AWRm78]
NNIHGNACIHKLENKVILVSPYKELLGNTKFGLYMNIGQNIKNINISADNTVDIICTDITRILNLLVYCMMIDIRNDIKLNKSVELVIKKNFFMEMFIFTLK